MTEAEELLKAIEVENHRTRLLQNRSFVELVGAITNIENLNHSRKEIARLVYSKRLEISNIIDRGRRNTKFKELKNNHSTLVLLLLELNKYKVTPPTLLLLPFFSSLANHSSLVEMNNSYKQHYKNEVF